MKKLLLILSLLSFLIYGCDNKKEENQKVEELEKKVQVLENKISQEEREKKVKERYEDLNNKTSKLLGFYIKSLLKHSPTPLPEFKYSSKVEFKKDNKNNVLVKYTFKDVSNPNKEEEIPISIDDIITFNEELEKQGILAKIERRINLNYNKIYSYRTANNNPKLLDAIDEFVDVFGFIYGGLYITLYEDGRNLAEYFITSYSSSNTENEVFISKFKFNGAEIRSEYLQKDLNNPLLLGNREIKFKGFDMLSNYGKNYLIINPFVAKYNYNKNGDLNFEIHNLDYEYNFNNKKEKAKVDKINFSAKLKQFPTTDEFVSLLLPTGQGKITLNGIEEDVAGIGKIRTDELSLIDNSIIREQDFDLDYKLTFALNSGIYSKVFQSIILTPELVKKSFDKFNFDVYKFSFNIKIPNLDKRIIEYAKLSSTQHILNKKLNLKQKQNEYDKKIIYFLLDSIVKNQFKLEVNFAFNTSLGDLKIASELSPYIDVKKIYNSDGTKKSWEEFHNAFKDGLNFKIEILATQKLVNFLLDNNKKADEIFKKYNLNPEQGKFIIEMKNNKFTINNKYISELKFK